MADGFFGDLTAPVAMDTPLEVVAFRLSLAALLGAVVATVYRFTQRQGSKFEPSFLATLVLLCVLIAMVTQVVGNSVARAFSLVGALSIVRFRTVVEDTRDTAFVIFTVIVGMAVGAGTWPLAGIGIGVVTVAATGLRWFPRPPRAVESNLWHLQIRVAAGLGRLSPWEPVFARHLQTFLLDSTATARQGASLDLIFLVQLQSKPMEFLNDLNRLEGIENLELKRK